MTEAEQEVAAAEADLERVEARRAEVATQITACEQRLAEVRTERESLIARAAAGEDMTEVLTASRVRLHSAEDELSELMGMAGHLATMEAEARRASAEAERNLTSARAAVKLAELRQAALTANRELASAFDALNTVLDCWRAWLELDPAGMQSYQPGMTVLNFFTQYAAYSPTDGRFIAPTIPLPPGDS